MTYKKLSWGSLLLLFFNINYGQYCFDGNYCPVPADFIANNCFPDVSDEYGAVEKVILSEFPSFSCEVGTIWGLLDDSDPVNANILLSFTHGNDGAGLISAYFNIDCDSLTGATAIYDPGSSGVIPVYGAEYRIILQSNGLIHSVGYWYSPISDFVAIPTYAEILSGNADGCGGTDGRFIEARIPLAELVNPCNVTNICNEIKLTTLVTSVYVIVSVCEAFPVNMVFPRNINPIAGFLTPDTLCQEISTEFPVVEIDAGNYSFDPDVDNGIDSLTYTWASTDSGAIFSNSSGVADAMINLNTTYQPSMEGVFEITLSLEDKYRCSSYASYEFVVLGTTNSACDTGIINPCEESMNISGTYYAGELIYLRTSGFISSNAQIQSNANITFDALDSVMLNPNFEVQLGAELSIPMEGCTSN